MLASQYDIISGIEAGGGRLLEFVGMICSRCEFTGNRL